MVAEGQHSTPCSVTSGVPQGSVLGLVLFLVYINDVSSNIHSELRLFADDILIYKSIVSADDHDILQGDLNTLVKWAEMWQMNFNLSKCNILQITTHRNVSHFVYEMRGIPLKTVDKHCYLGIHLHNKLSWHPHIDYISHKANRLLGFLKQNLHACPKYFKEYAYKQLVLPTIEYCCSIWDPCHQNVIDKLEMIQHQAARFVFNRPWNRHQRDSITDMLKELNWPSLQDRRRHARLILMYKITNHLLFVPDRCLPTPSHLTSTRAHHPQKFSHPQSKVDIYRYSFSPRTIPQWNNLPIPNLPDINLKLLSSLYV